MKLFPRLIFLLISITMLSACHADILYRLDIHANKTATVTLHESLDGELYQMVVGSGGADPLGIIAARKAGWTVSQHTLPDGGRVIELTDIVPVAKVSNILAEVLQSAGGSVGRGKMPALGLVEHRGLFFNDFSLRTAIPGIISKSASSNTSFSSMGQAMAASVMSLRFQLRAPGTVIKTNGTPLKNGYVQWDLNPNEPTPISYVVEVPAVKHILSIVVTALLVLVGAFAFVLRKRRLAVPHVQA